MQDIYRHIEEHFADSLVQLHDFCKLPSVSAQNQAILETAEHTASLLQALGFEAQILEKPGGQPVVYASQAGQCARTLMFYGHYDVQPAEPLELWSHPPFQATFLGEKVYGRGVSDNKGNIIARLAAIRAWRETRGALPCGVKFCLEGDEEIGSPHMDEFVAQHRDLLGADACLWEGGGVNWHGQPEIYLGVKGLLYVELESETISRDAHSSWATTLPSAAWRLVWALSTIKDSDEKVQIEGFYDDVRPPTAAEEAVIIAIPTDEEATLGSYGIDRFLCNVRGEAFHRRHLLEPTASIDGLISGYTGEGPKTVLPARAKAKMDFRLVPDQDPEAILAKLRGHLQSRGFGDISVRALTSEHPARTPPDHPFVEVVKAAARDIYAKEPVVIPTMAGTGPLHPFIETLGLPTADCGVGYPDNWIHAPNENIRVEDFRLGIKAIANLLQKFSDGPDF